MNLTIATGIKEYDITDEHGNVKYSVAFNPTDPNFAERLYAVFSDLDKKDEELHKRIKEENDHIKLFEIARQMDSEMRQMVNSVLGDDVCTPIFGSVSVYAIGDGLPLWANFLLAIMSEMDDALDREQKAANPRIKKYTERFKRKKAG